MWGQDGCERRIEVFVNIPKKKIKNGGSGLGGGGQGGCERRIEVSKKFGGGREGLVGGRGRVGGSGWM